MTFTRAAAYLSLLAVCFTSCAAFGYGNLQFKDVNNATVSSLWDARSFDSAAFPDGIPWHLDYQGTQGAIAITVEQLQAIVEDAFETWELVPESSIAFTNGGLTPEPSELGGHGLPPDPGLDGDNFVSFGDTPSGALGITYIFTLADEFTFDNTDGNPDNDTDFGGVDGNPDIPEGTYPAGTILDADIMLDKDYTGWTVTGDEGKLDLQGVLVHEIGHAIGLSHSCVRETFASQATMYPFSAYNPEGLEQQTLAQDDIAGVSAYYPSPALATNRGAISGTVTKSGQPQCGTHVWAVNPTDRSIVGAYSDEAGNYVLQGLLPGDYVLRIEPLPVDDLRINEILASKPASMLMNFAAEIYNDVVTEYEATTIAVVAGTTAGGNNFALQSPHDDPFEDDDSVAQARPLPTDGTRELHHIYPATDLDYFSFEAVAGHFYYVSTENIVYESLYDPEYLGYSSDTLVRIYAPDGERMIGKQTDVDPSNGRFESSILYPALETGTHYVRVQHDPYLLHDSSVNNPYPGACGNYDVLIREVIPEAVYVDGALGDDALGTGASDSPWATIQHAFDSVMGTHASPVVIRVAQGTYFENVICDRFESVFGGYASGTWQRDVSSYETVVDGGSTSSVFETNCNTILDGLTITNGGGHIYTLTNELYGGGIYIPDWHCRIQDCRITNNRAERAGYVFWKGGAIFIGWGYNDSNIISCTISDNVARTVGGGIYCIDSGPLISCNAFINNTAQSGGGGYFRVQSLLGMDIEHNHFLGNRAEYGSAGEGGGADFYQMTGGSRFVDNVLVGNYARNGGGMGGYLDGSGLVIQQNVIASNEASNSSGAMYNLQWSNLNYSVEYNCIVGNLSQNIIGGLRPENGYSIGGTKYMNNAIIGNLAMNDIGGMRCLGKVFLENNTIAFNNSPNTGGVAIANSTPILKNNTIAFNGGFGVGEYTATSDADVLYNAFFGNGAAYYDNDTAASYSTAADINTLVAGGNVDANIDSEPHFNPAPSGIAESVGPGSEAYQSILTDTEATFIPDALAGLTINPNTVQPLHFYIIGNTTDTITTWGDMTAVAAAPCNYMVFDYHLAADSPYIDAGVNVSADTVRDIDSEARPAGAGYDIGADEFTDSDADTIPDRIEGSDDPDNDGQPNYLDSDSDGDGIDDSVESTGNPDGDYYPNYLDADSDGDGLEDMLEGAADYDSDGLANFVDTDSDGDAVPDAAEGDADPDADSLPNFLDDESDGDGISDAREGMEDVDRDGIANYLDLDSDKDGLPDAWEAANNLDPYSAAGNHGASGDPDGDGVSNADEKVAGTDPTEGHIVWVRFQETPPGLGTFLAPYATLNAATSTVPPGTVIRICTGQSAETLRAHTPLRLEAAPGPVSVGAEPAGVDAP